MLVSCLPPDVQSELSAIAAMGMTQSDLKKSPKRDVNENKLTLGNFTVVLAAVATQGFPDIAPEARIMRLFEFAAASGGNTKIRTNRS